MTNTAGSTRAPLFLSDTDFISFERREEMRWLLERTQLHFYRINKFWKSNVYHGTRVDNRALRGIFEVLIQSVLTTHEL